MPSKQTSGGKGQVSKPSFEADAFLRSINLCFDAEAPGRIRHFRPTTKSVSLLNDLFVTEKGQKDRSFLVMAPYGTGKSLTVTYLLHLVENREKSREALKEIEARFEQISPEFARVSKKRLRKNGKSGLVVALHGACSSLAESLKLSVCEALGRCPYNGRSRKKIEQMPCENMKQAIALLNRVKEQALSTKTKKHAKDRIVILWDEFGRHIESLVSEDRAAALADVQELAEHVDRQKKFPMTLGLLLHQGFLQYASSLPKSTLVEWNKIEGRFRTIQYVDDSKEIFRLVASVVSSRIGDLKPPPAPAITRVAKEFRKNGLFKGFNQRELTRLFKDAYPLEPATLHLLPRLSARVAQNERTLFSFLFDVSLDGPVGPAALYDYFSLQMEVDNGPGGTHRQWVETQSAINRTTDGPDGEAAPTLKTACLLGLGAGGERSRAGLSLLELSLSGYEPQNGNLEIVEQLIEKKLLLHRKHSDEVSVWHGTDEDLRGRLSDEMAGERDAFDLLEFLNREAPPPAWSPVEYNDEFNMRRFLNGEYWELKRLSAHSQGVLSTERFERTVPPGCDGKIIYILAKDADELAIAQEIVESFPGDQEGDGRLIFAVPREPERLFNLALEASCIERVENDEEFMGKDPVLAEWIQLMKEDIWGQLEGQISRFVRPSPGGTRWFRCAKELKPLIENPKALRSELSKIIRAEFDKTPKINNEMIVRHKPTGVMVNARKKLVLPILESSGKENIEDGIKDINKGKDGPNLSMFRMVLRKTGLYHEVNKRGGWGYARSKDLDDPGLREVWDEIRKFVTEPGENKSFTSLFDVLLEPPYGVRRGLFPILVAAGLKAFPSVRSLQFKDSYVEDILSQHIEDLCRSPDDFSFTVREIKKAEKEYLLGVRKCFAKIGEEGTRITSSDQTDLIRDCYDAIGAWKDKLLDAALTTKKISNDSLGFQKLMKQKADPIQLLFDRLPVVFQEKAGSYKAILSKLSKGCGEMAGLEDIYIEEAVQALKQAFSPYLPFSRDVDVRVVAEQWAACLPKELDEESAMKSQGQGRIAFLRTARSAGKDKDQKAFVNKTSVIMEDGPPVEYWDDSSLADFESKVKARVREIEEIAFHSHEILGVEGLKKLAGLRIEGIRQALSKAIGDKEALEVLRSLIDDEREIAKRVRSSTGSEEVCESEERTVEIQNA